MSGTSPLLAYENEYDADGYLIPIPGEWRVYDQAGVDTCTDDLSLDPGVQCMELEVLDAGERILIREVFEDESVGPAFVLKRISASDTEATYWADMSKTLGGISKLKPRLVRRRPGVGGSKVAPIGVRSARWRSPPNREMAVEWLDVFLRKVSV